MSIFEPGTMTPRSKSQQQDAKDRETVPAISERECRVADNLAKTLDPPSWQTPGIKTPWDA